MNEDQHPTDRLILTMVHDLRACLRRSLTASQMLERACGAELAAEHRVLLAGVIAADKEMERLLGRLSDYANAHELGSGRPIPLDAALRIALQEFPQQPLQVISEAEGPSPAVPREFVRLFCELIGNGLKFSSGAAVSVRTAAPHIVEISDSGIGVEPGEEERVFEPFVRLHSRDQFPGFGLGLAIARRIADGAGAQVRLASRPGGGALATVTLAQA